MDRWIEVDLDKLAHNYRLVRNFIPQTVKMLAVVKSDAYGHGLIETGKLFAELGVDYMGVTEIAEGRTLRSSGVDCPVLVFAPFLAEELPALAEAGLTATISGLDMLKAFGEQRLPLKVHFKIETGLGRTGLRRDELAEAVILLQSYPQITLEGIYTHFATAMWTNDHFLQEQLAEFKASLQVMEDAGYHDLIKHAANSSALIKNPLTYFDMVRAGTILYGQDGALYLEQLGEALQDSWSLKVKITALHQLPQGHGVGYERAAITKRPTTVAILPVGYSHGLGIEPIMRSKKVKDLLKVVAKAVLRFLDHPRLRLYADYQGKRLPILGKIGMQLTMVDVTDCPTLKVGDIVQLPARRTTISGLLPKVYYRHGQQVTPSINDV